MIAWTLGVLSANMLGRTPFMLFFLMHDYLSALIWIATETAVDVWKKIKKFLKVLDKSQHMVYTLYVSERD